MLDETLPPAGDTEPAAPARAEAASEPAAAAADRQSTPDADDEPTPDGGGQPVPDTVADPLADEPALTASELPDEVPAAESATQSASQPAAAPADAPTDAPADTQSPATSDSAPQPVAPAPAPGPLPEMSPAACASQLAERFPALFAAGRALPVKLRIQVDIQARAPGVFTRKAMSLFLHRYTTSTAYLKALVASPHRFDLDGAAAGDVAAEHREAAQLELQRRQAIVQERRGAQRRMDRPPRAGPGRQPGSDGAAPAAIAPLAGGDVQPAVRMAEDRGRPSPTARHDQQRPQQHHRRPQAVSAQPESGRGERPSQGPRPPGQPGTPDRRPRELRSPRSPREPHASQEGVVGATPRSPPPPSLPAAEMEARRDRAALLRAYESSTLTKANFCVLKRVSAADLDAALAQARQERGEPASRPAR